MECALFCGILHGYPQFLSHFPMWKYVINYIKWKKHNIFGDPNLMTNLLKLTLKLILYTTNTQVLGGDIGLCFACGGGKCDFKIWIIMCAVFQGYKRLIQISTNTQQPVLEIT